MDYLALKKLYGRLQGINATVDREKLTPAILGKDYNQLVDKINEDFKKLNDSTVQTSP